METPNANTPWSLPWHGADAPQMAGGKKYDVYIVPYQSLQAYVFQKVRFKGIRRAPSSGHSLWESQFYLLEQDDGSEVCLQATSILMFCEHGTVPAIGVCSPADTL